MIWFFQLLALAIFIIGFITALLLGKTATGPRVFEIFFYCVGLFLCCMGIAWWRKWKLSWTAMVIIVLVCGLLFGFLV
jgi:FtsH-binding integral membrane protein